MKQVRSSEGEGERGGGGWARDKVRERDSSLAVIGREAGEGEDWPE